MMIKLTRITHAFTLLTCLLIALPLGLSAAKSPSKQQLHSILQDNNHEAVRSLAEGEREILLGMLALEAGKTAEAIAILNRPEAVQDPLAALIRAEAYRRQSVKAAMRAGNYAHSVNSDISKLKNARLSAGLNRAEQRMQLFIDRLNHPEKVIAKPVAAKADAPSQSLPDGLRADIEQWRKDWQSLNADAYLSHYHPDFKTSKHDFTSWSQYKRRINGRKSYIQVTTSNLKVIGRSRQIEQGEAVLVEFRQNYESSNYSASGRKRLYLVRSGGTESWQILFEGEPGQAIPSFAETRVNVNNTAALQSLPETTHDSWAINIGSFDSRSNAEEMASNINVPPGEKQPFVSQVFSAGRVIHRVRIGLFATRADAVSTMLEACPALGLTDCWLEQMK